MSIFNFKNKKDNDKERKKQVENKEISKSTVPTQMGLSPNGQNNLDSRRKDLNTYRTNQKGVNPIGTNPMESISVDVYKSQIPYAFDQVIPKDPIPKYKRLVDKKLTVILIENTDETANIKDMLIKIIKSTVSCGLICVIKYGNYVEQSSIMDVASFDGSSLLSADNEQNAICLYNALKALEDLVNKEYMVIHEKEFERERINQLEVIGIGTCKDNCSVVSKEEGIASFCNVAKKLNITTKYFCITEESFVSAAEIGFHSIGAISRNY